MQPVPTHSYSTAVYDFEDLLESFGMSRFHDGTHPVAHEVSLRNAGPVEDLVPDGFVEVRRAIEDEVVFALFEAPDAVLMIRRWDSGHARCGVTGVDREVVGRAISAIRAAVPEPDPDDGRVDVDFVHDTGRNPSHHRRRLVGPQWADIRRNYPEGVQGAVDRLVALDRPVGEARLVLWHGPPGTGKTTAARSLARAWAPWCRTMYVVDPDQLLGSPRYLIQLLLGGGDGGDELDPDTDDTPRPPWRLLLIEDADELLRADAKATAGQALSRLLNLGDGFLGQGLQLLILISTNERVERLHPAVTRPGRCLANVHFGPFDRAEAESWLGENPGAGAEFTLAELFHRAGRTRKVDVPARAPAPAGQYL